MAAVAFPKDFTWGASTAAYQIEGAAYEDGKGESIWDRFCRIPGAIRNGESGDTACDHYHRWREDVALMSSLGLTGYRFSISWPRLFPQGKGFRNQRGFDFYEHLVDALLEKGIEPAITLYHWDLPQTLQDQGGWLNRDTASWFAEYAAHVFGKLGDRVKTWMTLNEPHIAAFLGHAEGLHAPGTRDLAAAVQASHVLHLAHALGIQACRQVSPVKHRIGIALDLRAVYPLSDSDADASILAMADCEYNRWYLDPIMNGVYPEELFAAYERVDCAPRVEPEDMALLKANPVDFIGANYYFPVCVKATRDSSLLGFAVAEKSGSKKTEMGWEIEPRGLYDLLLRLKHDYGDPVVLITENGAACADAVLKDGEVQDDDRIEYVASHLEAARAAIGQGVKLQGYYLWSLMDNFEWSFGFTKRFGILSVDFRTGERVPKKSARWYRRVIATGGAELAS